MWGLKAARGPSETARSAQSPPCISQHISKDKGVYWRSNMLCIKQAAPCSDSCECSSSVRLNIWQGSDVGWLPSALIQHSPVRLTIAGLRILKPWWTRRTSTESKQLPSLSLKILMHPDLKAPQAGLCCQYSSHRSADNSKHSLVAAKEVIPNGPGEMA